MKNLIDNIIEKLIERKEEQHNPIVRREFESAIEEIKEIESEAEFEEVARVMIKHLANKYHPHHIVIITNTTSELFEGKKACGEIMDYIPD